VLIGCVFLGARHQHLIVVSVRTTVLGGAIPLASKNQLTSAVARSSNHVGMAWAASAHGDPCGISEFDEIRTIAMPTAGQDEPLPVIRIDALSESRGRAPVSKKLR
jgi:hypothetical protein